MNFEAVPCVLRNADGQNVVGLLIRPAQTTVRPAAVQVVESRVSPTASAAPRPRLASAGGKLPLPALRARTPSASVVPSFAAAPSASICRQQHLPATASVAVSGAQGQAQSTGGALQQQQLPLFISACDAKQYHQELRERQPQASYLRQGEVGGGVDVTVNPYARFRCPQAYEYPPQFGQVDCATRSAQPAVSQSPRQHATRPNGSTLSSSDLGPLLDEMTPLDLASILAESESVLAPDCPALMDGAISVDAASVQQLSRPPNHQTVYSVNSSQPSSSSLMQYDSYRSMDHFIGSRNGGCDVSQAGFADQMTRGPSNVQRPSCQYQVAVEPSRQWRALGASAPRPPQLDWELAPNEASSTPDSGIQSITGSPPANQMRTPPLLLPPSSSFADAGCSGQQISPSSSSTSARSSRASHSRAAAAALYDAVSDCEPTATADERPTSSSSAATKAADDRPLSPPLQPPPKKKRRRTQRRRARPFDGMPRLQPIGRRADEPVGERAHADSPAAAATEASCVLVGVDVGSRVTKMDERFDVVCLNVLSGVSAAAPPPQPAAAVDAQSIVDPNSVVDRIISSLNPEQLEQVSSLLQTKMRQTSAASIGSPPQPGACHAAISAEASKCHDVLSPPIDEAPETAVETVPIKEEPNREEEERRMKERLLSYRSASKRAYQSVLLKQIRELLALLDGLHIGDGVHATDTPQRGVFQLDMEGLKERIAERAREQAEADRVARDSQHSKVANASADDDEPLITELLEKYAVTGVRLRIRLSALRDAVKRSHSPPVDAPSSAQHVPKRPAQRRTPKAGRNTRRRSKKAASSAAPTAAQTPATVGKGYFRRCAKCAIWVRSTADGDASDCPLCCRRRQGCDEKRFGLRKCAVVVKKMSQDVALSRAAPMTERRLPPPSKHYATAGAGDKRSDSLHFDGCALERSREHFGEHFRLPYDVWWQSRYPDNGGQQQAAAPEPYKKIRSNVIVDQPARLDSESRCSCEGGGCGDSCLNRVIFTECNQQWCALGDACSNRRIQKRQFSAALQLFDTRSARGRGVRTNACIGSGQLICEYVGEVLSSARFADRTRSWYGHFAHHYALELDGGFVIDSYRCGGLARFVNHSCEPNCEMQKWNVNGQYRMCLFALRDIGVGEELTYDYKFRSFGGQQGCLCGAGQCRGVIGTESAASSSTSPSRSTVGRALSHRERLAVRRRRTFLLRNFDRMRPVRLGLSGACEQSKATAKPSSFSHMIRANVSAMETSRSVRTRCLAAADDKQHLVSLALVLRRIYAAVLRATTEAGKLILTSRTLSGDAGSLLRQVNSSIFEGHFAKLSDFDEAVHEAIVCVAPTLPEFADVKHLQSAYLEAKSDAVDELRDVIKVAIPKSFLLPHVSATRPRSAQQKPIDALLPAVADLSYLESSDAPVVGAYDADEPDETCWPQLTGGGGDCVRCVCGVFEEDGLMVQCDACSYWLHAECVRASGADEHYVCHFCCTRTRRIPALDICLAPQPDLRLSGCVYFRSLVDSRSRLQVRINECVYVTRLIDERHRRLLRQLHEQCVRCSEGGQTSAAVDEPATVTPATAQAPVVCSRRDLRCLRVERLFIGPGGNRFVFGCYYARPHETFCEPTRRFHKKEVFLTPLYETLPLDAVVGRCLVLDAATYCRGRPRLPRYADEDVYLCEYRLDKNQRLFEKICGKNRYFQNTDKYIFEHFDERLKIRRQFTPFVMPDDSAAAAANDSDNEDSLSLKTIRAQLQLKRRRRKATRVDMMALRLRERGASKCDLHHESID